MVQGKKPPLRRCVGCLEMKDKKELIRILKDEENHISIDLSGRRNGRGAYICPDENCLMKAMKSRALERSLKSRVDSSIYDSLSEELNRFKG
jgi:predicted RNA-binding protein YlxR (DUF448 family)